MPSRTAPAPEDVHLCAQFHAEVNGVHRLLQGIRPHFRVVAGERAIFESRMGEEVGGRHRDDEARVFQRFFEVFDNLLALSSRGINRHEVVVVEVDAVCADLSQKVDDFDGRERLAHRMPKRIAANVAHRPQAEGEFVLGGWIEIAHVLPPGVGRRGVGRDGGLDLDRAASHQRGPASQAGCLNGRAGLC